MVLRQSSMAYKPILREGNEAEQPDGRTEGEPEFIRRGRIEQEGVGEHQRPERGDQGGLLAGAAEQLEAFGDGGHQEGQHDHHERRIVSAEQDRQQDDEQDNGSDNPGNEHQVFFSAS